MADDLDDFLGKLGSKLDADYRTNLAAAENLENERQAFLQNFRNIADGEILPIFNRAAERSTDALLIKVANGPTSVELRVQMKKDKNLSADGVLRYYADLDRRKVMLAGQIPQLPRRDQAVPVSGNDLKPEKIQQAVVLLIRDLAFALEQRTS